MKQKKSTKIETRLMPKIQWIADGARYRVWRTDWYHDQFELMTLAEWASVKWVCEKFNIPFEENIE